GGSWGAFLGAGQREARQGGGVTPVGAAPAVALGDAASLEERRHGAGDERWHATQEPARASRNAGASVRQRSNAAGHRGWNAHPGGRSRSGGGRPGMPWNDPFRARDGRVAISIPV